MPGSQKACEIMSGPGSEPSDDVWISFVLAKHGWSELAIQAGGERLRLCISQVFTDAPLMLLTLCRSILENYPCRIALCDEPGGHIIEVTPIPQQDIGTRLTIYRVDHPVSNFSIDTTGMKILAVNANRRRLFAQIITELWKVHKFLSEPSYKSGRDVAFPHRDLRALNFAWDAHPTVGPSFLR